MFLRSGLIHQFWSSCESRSTAARSASRYLHFVLWCPSSPLSSSHKNETFLFHQLIVLFLAAGLDLVWNWIHVQKWWRPEVKGQLCTAALNIFCKEVKHRWSICLCLRFNTLCPYLLSINSVQKSSQVKNTRENLKCSRACWRLARHPSYTSLHICSRPLKCVLWSGVNSWNVPEWERLFQQEDEDLWRSVWSQSRPAPRRSGNVRKFGLEAFSAWFLSKQPFGQVHGGSQDKKTQEPASEWPRFWSLEPGCQLRLRPDRLLFTTLHVKIQDAVPSCSMIRILFIHWLGYSGELIPRSLRSKSIVELFLQCSCLFGGTDGFFTVSSLFLFSALRKSVNTFIISKVVFSTNWTVFLLLLSWKHHDLYQL